MNCPTCGVPLVAGPPLSFDPSLLVFACPSHNGVVAAANSQLPSSFPSDFERLVAVQTYLELSVDHAENSNHASTLRLASKSAKQSFLDYTLTDIIAPAISSSLWPQSGSYRISPAALETHSPEQMAQYILFSQINSSFLR